jgi:molybdopterin/thiamine biosynthesis adenylyltransferase
VDVDRYHRQSLLPQVGRDGQARLGEARVLLVGCGALGSVIAEQFVRAGVGFLRVVDRDVVELTNLQRQVLYDEDDARRGVPKAAAAGERLRRINSAAAVDAVVVDVHSGNVEALAGVTGEGPRVDLVLDGTDNVETRYLLNDVAVKHRLSWVYGACVGVEGRVMPITPGRTPCLRCLFPQPPGPGELPTCDTAGVLGPAAAVVASLQVVAAMKLLLAPPEVQASAAAGPAASAAGGASSYAGSGTLVTVDTWALRFRTIDVAGDRQPDCPCCGQRRFEFLERRPAGGTTSLCGRDAVQVTAPDARSTVDLKAMAATWRSAAGEVELTPFLIRCRLPEPPHLRLTLFADGRLIVKGTTDVRRARSMYARYVGT